MSRSGLPWLSVLTCPVRPNYLEQTIAAIDAAGGERFPGTKLICVDGDPVAFAPLGLAAQLRAKGWVVAPAYEDRRLHGSAAAMRSILTAAAIDGAPWLLYLEDDVILARHAVAVMARMFVPDDCWALQFCDLKHQGPVGGADPIALTRYDTDHHWGTQALKIPRWTLERVAGATNVKHLHPRGHASDVLLGQLARTERAPYVGIVAPSIVQHVGRESICNPNRELNEYGRSAHNFPGVDFDARLLLGGE